MLDRMPYAALIRAALENKLHAIVSGPNCRSCSIMRHYKVVVSQIAHAQSELGGEEEPIGRP